MLYKYVNFLYKDSVVFTYLKIKNKLRKKPFFKVIYTTLGYKL